MFFSGEEAQKWYGFALKEFIFQLDEQILGDGAHFELSPMYHNIILEDVLDIIHIMQIYDVRPDPVILEKAQKMLSFSYFMAHPDGKIAFFNDATHGVACKYAELVEYAKILGIIDTQQCKGNLINTESGYQVIKNKEHYLCFKASNILPKYQPGHTHADALSFEMSLGDERIFVNAGISTYDATNLRAYQRSTKAHNTVEIDGKNSCDVWSSFRVGKRLKINDFHAVCTDNNIVLQASHNGYSRMRKPLLHKRKMCVLSNSFLISDKVIGSQKHLVKVYFHIYPGVDIFVHSDSLIILQTKRFTIKCVSDHKIEVIETKYYPGFYLEKPMRSLLVKYNTNLPVTHQLKINWDKR